MLTRLAPDSSKAYHVLFVLAVLFAIVLRIVGTVNKGTINHDESISYLAATCHQGEYSSITQGTPPFGAWAEVSDWKRFLQPEKLFCFEEIATDLSQYDIHPPLYFWILHLWAALFGVNSWTGPSLNIVFAILTIYFLYRFARNTLTNPDEAKIVVLIWALSPAVITISLEARQYDLLTLIALAFTLQTVHFADLSRQLSLKDAVILALLVAAGALTHFNFVLVVLGCCIFLTIKLIKNNLLRLITACISMGTGYLLFILLHPRFYSSIIQWQGYVHDPFTFAELFTRIKQFGVAFSDFFLPWHSLGLVFSFGIIILAGGGWVAILMLKQPSIGLDFLKIIQAENMNGLFFFFWNFGITTILYIAFLSPIHAMGPKYLNIAWLFFGFIPVMLLRKLGSLRDLMTLLFCTVILLSSTASVIYTINQNKSNHDWAELLANSERVIIDNDARGILLPIIWEMPDNKLIFAASQNYLLNNQGAWLKNLDNTAYISVVYYDSTLEYQQDIISIIKQDHQAVLFLDEGEVWGVGTIFMIQARNN
jgi:4-amino-4-deoxy-L-arabinose transferase-like glycosyltransferase